MHEADTSKPVWRRRNRHGKREKKEKWCCCFLSCGSPSKWKWLLMGKKTKCIFCGEQKKNHTVLFTDVNWIRGRRKFVCDIELCEMNWQTMNRLQSEHAASLWPILHAASPWHFTCPADTMRYILVRQLPLSCCAQFALREWDMHSWLTDEFLKGWVLLKLLIRFIDSPLTSFQHILFYFFFPSIFPLFITQTAFTLWLKQESRKKKQQIESWQLSLDSFGTGCCKQNMRLIFQNVTCQDTGVMLRQCQSLSKKVYVTRV